MSSIPEASSANPLIDHSDLSYLLRRERLRVLHWREITTLRTRYLHRRTYCLQLDDGTMCKARLVRRRLAARRMRRLLPLLPSASVAQLLAHHRRAVLEQWIDGPTADRLSWHEPLLNSAGELLGRIHRAVAVRQVEPQDRQFGVVLRAFRQGLSALCRRSVISTSSAQSILELAHRNAPRRAHWGLVHRDFCAENLVVRRTKTCVIDNVTVRLGFLEEDLARSCLRWPMSESQFTDFLAGYDVHADSGPFICSRRFWMLVASVLAAALRLRAGADGLTDACRVIGHWISGPSGKAA